MDKAMKRAILKDQRLSKLKLRLLAKQNGLCVKCGEPINLEEEASERDHIIPKMEGGKDTFKNTVILHKVCHEKKTSWERK
jgi:5-methylcytosine-specific restriction endonuclease McrA